MNMATEERDWVERVGAPAFASIAEMVTALECDYERLAELREERDSFEPSDPNDDPLYQDMDLAEQWAARFPDEAAELAELEDEAGDCSDRDAAEQRIQEDALDVTIRGERRDGQWTADEFQILLTTGGPAVRIVGELDDGEPTEARLEVQDWFKPWTEYVPADQDTLLAYCRCFYFGE